MTDPNLPPPNPPSDSTAPAEPNPTRPVDATRTFGDGATLADGAQPTEAYETSSIRTLEGIDHIRLRPEMYIHDTGSRGLHHLVSEVVDNSIDEAMAGFASTIQVRLNVDGSVTVSDDGRGIPVGIHREAGVSALQLVFTKTNTGGKFDKKSYKVSGGLHGVGVKAVNALSEWLEVEVRREGKVYRMECRRGVIVEPVHPIGESTATGTKVTFKPDSTVFPDVKFKASTLETRCRELAFLNPKISTRFVDEESGADVEYYTDDGVRDFVKYLNKSESTLHEPVVVRGRREVDVGDDKGFV
ncbi:MAG: ATP-binding protein, partial [Planctomycetia bacterium]